jgi:hypothetical protein
MPRLRQNGRERAMGMVQAVQIQVVFCDQSDLKFGRLLDQVFYGQCLHPLSYGSGDE